MAFPTTLPIIAALALMGTAAGVGLGRSAIAEINPAHFADSEPFFHADLGPYQSPDWAQVQVAEYQSAGMVEGLGDGCVQCREYPEEYRPSTDPVIEAAEGWEAEVEWAPEHRAVAVRQAAYSEFREEDEAEMTDPEVERVQLYSGFTVASGEAEADEVLAEESGSDFR